MWTLLAKCDFDPRGWRCIAYGDFDRCLSVLRNSTVRKDWQRARLEWTDKISKDWLGLPAPAEYLSLP
jgi:hypothetical protein